MTEEHGATGRVSREEEELQPCGWGVFYFLVTVRRFRGDGVTRRLPC